MRPGARGSRIGLVELGAMESPRAREFLDAALVVSCITGRSGCCQRAFCDGRGRGAGCCLSSSGGLFLSLRELDHQLIRFHLDALNVGADESLVINGVRAFDML